MTEWLIEEVTTENIRLLNHFLKQNGEQSANRGDLNFWLKEHGKTIAVARLIPAAGETSPSFWLRGLFVVEAHRKQGLGHQFMLQIHAHLKQKFQITQTKTEQACLFAIYAFPHGHLKPFYSPLGYQIIEPEDLPESLRKRYQQAKNANKDWLCMSYSVYKVK